MIYSGFGIPEIYVPASIVVDGCTSSVRSIHQSPVTRLSRNIGPPYLLICLSTKLSLYLEKKLLEAYFLVERSCHNGASFFLLFGGSSRTMLTSLVCHSRVSIHGDTPTYSVHSCIVTISDAVWMGDTCCTVL